MITWEYVAELASVHTKDCDVDEVWRMASRPLTALGYRLSHHGSKFRVGPKDP